MLLGAALCELSTYAGDSFKIPPVAHDPCWAMQRLCLRWLKAPQSQTWSGFWWLRVFGHRVLPRTTEDQTHRFRVNRSFLWSFTGASKIICALASIWRKSHPLNLWFLSGEGGRNLRSEWHKKKSATLHLPVRADHVCAFMLVQ